MSIPPPVGPDIVEFAMSSEYLDKSYLSVPQVSILKGLYGLSMSVEERGAFLELTEGRAPRKGGYGEAAIICGVRSGKTELGALVLTYECVRWLPVVGSLLPPGKTAKGIIIAQNEKQAGEAREYIEGALLKLESKYGGVLAVSTGQDRAITGKGIRLNGPVEISIYPSKHASVRGSTGLVFVGDEVAFWESAEGAYNQDVKIMKAVRSRFATLSRLKPRRLLISSPDEEDGVLWESYRVRDRRPSVLVINAPSWVLNPAIEQSFLDEEQERDPEGFLSEYGAQFRQPGGSNSFLPADIIDACIQRGRLQVPPKAGVEYLAWMDAAFKRDRFSFGIGHAVRSGETTRVVVDYMRHWTPRAVAKGRKAVPLDDEKVIAAIVADMRPYGCDRIHGDQFADIPLKNRFARDHGIAFIESPVSNPEKVEAFKNLRAALRAGLVDLPDDKIMSKDMKCLIRKKTAGGHVSIAAPRRKGSYDDAANVVARIVSRLLPLSSAVDIAELNELAMGDDVRHRAGWDWIEAGHRDDGIDSLLREAYRPISGEVF